MSVSKKTNSKSAKSPAPATKLAATSKAAAKIATPKAAVAKTRTAVASIQAAAPKATATLAPVVIAADAPAVKASAAKPAATTIKARVDVGFGNALFIRGEGASLSWDRGTAMECVGADLWQIVLNDPGRSCTFKFLVNDTQWSTGADFSIPSGASITLTPEF